MLDRGVLVIIALPCNGLLLCKWRIQDLLIEYRNFFIFTLLWTSLLDLQTVPFTALSA